MQRIIAMLFAIACVCATQALAQTFEVDVRRDVEYAVHDGTRLTGNLFSPRGAERRPVMIAIHGGGWQAASPDIYQYWGPYLARRGYHVFAIRYRLSRPNQPTFPQAVYDVRAAIQFARARAAELRIDPDKIGLMGDSAGAHLAALTALAGDTPAFAERYRDDANANVSARVRVAVTVYGVYDMAAQWNHDQLHRPTDQITQSFIGVPPMQNRRLYFDASPIAYATIRDNAPSFLVVWGTEDDIVDYNTQSVPFLIALKQARFFARSVILTGAPHFWMADPIEEEGSHGAFLAPRLLRFLEQRLQ